MSHKEPTKQLLANLIMFYADNFVTYYKAHAYHFNIQGPMFSQDHEFLKEIYEFLYENHDGIGEQIRQLDRAVLPNLAAVLACSSVKEEVEPDLAYDKIFENLNKTVYDLKEKANDIYLEAGKQGLGGLETYLGDYCSGLNKLCWKIKATLGKSIK
jgi:starvation-inducible DNA-binding protein